jgi:hypothetical protein
MSHTPGPWEVARDPRSASHSIVSAGNNIADVWQFHVGGEQAAANALLISAAPDHALVLRGIIGGWLRWEPFQANDGHGELCFGGIRHLTRLDDFGCPLMTDNLRQRIAAEGGGA